MIEHIRQLVESIKDEIVSYEAALRETTDPEESTALRASVDVARKHLFQLKGIIEVAASDWTALLKSID